MIQKIKVNSKLPYSWCVLFDYNNKKYLLHTYEETETDYLPETYLELSEYFNENNKIKLSTIAISEKTYDIKDFLDYSRNKPYSHYNFEEFLNNVKNIFVF